MNGSSQLNFTERIESLKAGTLAAIALESLWVMFLGIHHSPWLPQSLVGANLATPGTEHLLISALLAGFSAFLFGVTYRYIIRQDQNQHLKMGAVLAFALVRALAAIEVGWGLSTPFWPWLLLGCENIILFAGATTLLEIAIRRRWLSPFPSSP